MNNSDKKIVIIGGGPAGLTAGLSFLQKSTEYEIIVLESENQLGGLSRTHQYKGNRMDIGGHRFFSKSDEVMQWWLNLMPVDQSALVGDLIPQSNNGSELTSPEKKQKIQINYQGKSREIEIDSLSNKRLNDEEHLDFADETIHAGGQYLEIEANEANSNFHVQVGNGPKMLIRNRLSRIYYLRKFFKYPINLSWQTLPSTCADLILNLIRSGGSCNGCSLAVQFGLCGFVEHDLPSPIDLLGDRFDLLAQWQGVLIERLKARGIRRHQFDNRLG